MAPGIQAIQKPKRKFVTYLMGAKIAAAFFAYFAYVCKSHQKKFFF